MIGGIVIEVAEIRDRPGVIFVDCRGIGTEQSTTCAIYVQKNEKSLKIEIGDSLWWQSGNAYWTPVRNRGLKHARCGIDYDIAIPRVGYSGVEHPSRRAQEPQE